MILQEHPLYQMINGLQNNQSAPVQQTPQLQVSGIPQFQNPVQKMSYIMQAMQNPGQFVREHVSGIPDQIAGDPNQILRLMQQSWGISNQQVQQIASQVPRF